MRIAVVDDEKNWLVKIKRYIKEYFGEMDVEIRTFFSSEAFLEDAGEYQFVFMDIEMQGRDGFSVLQEYRMEHVDSLFIILTTHIEMSREGYKVEACRYIDKYKMEEIREALDSAPLKSLARKLKDKGFVLTNRFCLVNLEHIRKVE